MHDEAPDPDPDTDPAAQSRHDGDAAVGAYRPTAHGLHADDREALVVPAGQLSHATAELVVENWPGAQAKQRPNVPT